MAIVLELMIIPVLLLTVIMLGAAVDLHPGVIFAVMVFLGILYVVFVGALKEAHEDLDPPAPGDGEAPEEPEAVAGQAPADRHTGGPPPVV